MPVNKLELKLIKNADNTEVELDNLSVDNAKSLMVFIDAITKLVENTPNNKGLKISIRKGCAAVSAVGSENQILNIQTEFESVLNHNSKNQDIIDTWRDIQTQVTKTDAKFDVIFQTHTVKKSILKSIKTSTQFRKKSDRTKPEFETTFIKGKLVKLGGNIAKIYIEPENEKKLTIACNKINAVSANKFLYKDIMISSWKRVKVGAKPEYQFCDFYQDEDIWMEFNEFITAFYHEDTDEIVALKNLHYKCKEYIVNNDFVKLKKFLRLFKHKSTDINILKMILITTKSFKEHVDIGFIIEELDNLYETKK